MSPTKGTCWMVISLGSSALGGSVRTSSNASWPLTLLTLCSAHHPWRLCASDCQPMVSRAYSWRLLRSHFLLTAAYVSRDRRLVCNGLMQWQAPVLVPLGGALYETSSQLLCA